MPVGSSPQLFLAARRLLARERLFQVSVHAFIRIQLRAVGWQVVHLDLRAVGREPVPHQPGAVGLEPIHDEEHLAPSLPDQALKEANEGRAVHRAIDDHPSQLALVGHRRDQAQLDPGLADPHHRGPAPRSVGAAAHVIRAQAGFITPDHDAAGLLGARHDLWVVPPQPAPYRHRVLLVGAPDRLLRGEAPARQVLAHRAHRQLDPAVASDQRPHRRPAPERKGQAQLVWRMAADQRLDLRLLRRVQQALLAWLAPARPADDPFRPLGREAVADIEHPGWAQPNQIGNCLIGHPALAKPDDLPPALLLGRGRQLAHVHVPHARPIWSIPAATQDNEGRINSLLEGTLPEYGALGTVREPTGGAIATAAPSNAYRARDGVWVLIAANSDPLFRR